MRLLPSCRLTEQILKLRALGGIQVRVELYSSIALNSEMMHGLVLIVTRLSMLGRQNTHHKTGWWQLFCDMRAHNSLWQPPKRRKACLAMQVRLLYSTGSFLSLRLYLLSRYIVLIQNLPHQSEDPKKVALFVCKFGKFYAKLTSPTPYDFGEYTSECLYQRVKL